MAVNEFPSRSVKARTQSGSPKAFFRKARSAQLGKFLSTDYLLLLEGRQQRWHSGAGLPSKRIIPNNCTRSPENHALAFSRTKPLLDRFKQTCLGPSMFTTLKMMLEMLLLPVSTVEMITKKELFVLEDSPGWLVSNSAKFHWFSFFGQSKIHGDCL